MHSRAMVLPVSNCNVCYPDILPIAVVGLNRNAISGEAETGESSCCQESHLAPEWFGRTIGSRRDSATHTKAREVDGVANTFDST